MVEYSLEVLLFELMMFNLKFLWCHCK